MRHDPLRMHDIARTVQFEVRARFENTEIGKCPVCHASMESAELSGIDVFVCTEHCVCLPKPDQQ